ncbi:hypothetical protein FEDK69T_13340 [Flavobacterium enshiense DK69]|uniref:TlpA family protein disulfide reductase n=1 Tax=Flavobacterium enshiense TaxID=1341165 RepID=UPI0003C5D4E0|nr:TlpA disulfide reductase family protein [Flavobacterium enshiense]ESU23182.1 hypothetical protein FEDK69T_13340 [Flavobacterium enshiense DK69]
MRTIFLSILFFLNYSVAISQNSVNNNHVVLIFDSYTKGNSVAESGIYYSKANDFRTDFVYPKNSKDTVLVNEIESKMILTHVFDLGLNYVYEFQKGDTVKFDYKNGLPRVSLLNKRTVLKYDLNFEDDFKSINRPSEPFVFSMVNKRPRTKEENLIYEKELSDYFVARDNKLDELLDSKLISLSIYTVHKARNRFLRINLNKANFAFASVPESDLIHDNLLSVKTYKYFLENYIIEKYNVRKLNDFDYDAKQAFDASFSDSKLSYKTKEYLLFSFLNAIANSKDKDAFSSYFEKFKVFEKGTELSQLIKDSYLLDLDALKNETNQTVLLDENKRKTTLDNLIAKHKGKLVYVDFWASWCAPCRASFPYSHKLQKELNAKDVVFLYLSTDDNFEAWKKANAKENLAAGDSFYLLNTKASEFIQKLNLKSIPRYVLFDKEGKLVNANAFGPKEEKCKTELLHLLNK